MSFLVLSGLADDGLIRKAGSVVSANVAPNEPLNQMKWPREKLVQVPHSFENNLNTMHGQPFYGLNSAITMLCFVPIILTFT